jgi:AraC-like DNA-binding protein
VRFVLVPCGAAEVLRMAATTVSHVIDHELLRPYLEAIPVESGRLRVTADYDNVWQIRNQVRMVTVSSGLCTVTAEGKQYTLCQNDLFFMFRGGRYTVRCSTPEPTELWWLDMQGQGVNAVLTQLPVSGRDGLIRGIPSADLTRELDSLVMHSADMSAGDALENLGAVYRILAVLLSECRESAWSITPYDSPEILYTGVWSKWPSPNGRQHNECYTGTARSYAEFNFFGTGIRWFGTLNFDCGRADVMIDGVHQTTVDTYNPVRLPRQLLYSNTRLPRGHHIIKIFCTGEANPKAINCDVVVESFHCFTAEPAPAEPRPGFRSGLVRDAAKYISLNYASDLSVDQLAREFGVSRAHLTARFGAELGVSPTQYLANQRISEAKRLLISGSLPVFEVAAAVGFKDAFYFSRFFRKNEGVTPSQYRKLHADEKALLSGREAGESGDGKGV